MTLATVSLQAAAQHLRAGGLACFPTETLWSLSCRAVPDPLARLRAAKGRPDTVSLAVGFAAWADARRHVETTPWAEALAAAFLPGPLSIVLRRADPALAMLAPDRETLSVRVPDHPVATAMLAAAGPLVMTSANRHGGPDPHTRDDLDRALAEAGDGAGIVVVGDGPVPGIGSTVVDATGPAPRVLREGIIPKHEVVAAWP